MEAKAILSKLRTGEMNLKDVSDITLVIMRCEGDPEIPKDPPVSPELFDILLKNCGPYSIPVFMCHYDYESQSLKPYF